MLKYFLRSNLHDVIFVRNSFRRSIYMAYILLIINFLIIGMLFYNLFSIQPGEFFATTTDGQIITITPKK